MAGMKVKTHKGSAKRFTKTASWEYKHDKARKNHLMSNKGRADKPFDYGKLVDKSNKSNVKALIPYA